MAANQLFSTALSFIFQLIQNLVTKDFKAFFYYEMNAANKSKIDMIHLYFSRQNFKPNIIYLNHD